MEFNKSQLLVIGTIFSSVLVIPDLDVLFTEEIIKIVMQDPSAIMIILVSILKIILILSSVIWLIQLIKNIEFTHRTKSKDVFVNFLFTLALTAVLAFIVSIIAKKYVPF